VGSFERVDMSSVPWKRLCLIASVLCLVVGLIELFESGLYSWGLYSVICSPLFAYTHIFLNRQKQPSTHNRLN